MLEQIRTTVEPSGILLASIDMPDRRMNVFSEALMDALDALMDRVERDEAIVAVVLTSSKPTFLAGADLSMVRGFTETAKHASTDELTALCGRLGRQFVRLEAQSKPWVAAVNGLALGGGLELAMACRARVVVDDPRAQLGLPEVRWGLLPGAGGTQRLPRLVGFDAGMTMLLGGKPIAPAEAVRLGLVGKAVPANALLDEARQLALALVGPYDATHKFPHHAHVERADRTAVAQRFGVTDEALRLYPAHAAIIDSVLEGAGKPLDVASAIEMKHFLTLMIDPVAGRMVRALYLDKLRAERAIPAQGTLQRISVASDVALPPTKVSQVIDTVLPSGTVELVDASGAHRIAFTTLDGVARDGAHVVLSPAGPYGSVLELVGVPEALLGTLALFAQSVQAMAWRTPGPTSVLQALHGRSLDEQARLAASVDVEPAFLDVAACLSGVTPAWTGGPLSYAREAG